MKLNNLTAVYFGLILALGGCRDKPVGAVLPSRSPDEIFREFVSPSVPAMTYAFDCKETRISPGEISRWVAFDILMDDWEKLNKQNQLTTGGGYSLKRVGIPEVGDTGFQGYLDGDFLTWFDKNGGVYFVRRLDEKFFRIVFFKRDT